MVMTTIESVESYIDKPLQWHETNCISSATALSLIFKIDKSHNDFHLSLSDTLEEYSFGSFPSVDQAKLKAEEIKRRYLAHSLEI